MADVQHVRTDLNDTINDRNDMLIGIVAALQNVSVTPAATQRYRISDLIPSYWEGSSDKEDVRDLHKWVQAWSDEGETMLVSVESTSSTTAHLQ